MQDAQPDPQMKIGPGFRIWTAIDAAAASRVDIPQTENGRHFYLSYHLKGVCNTHCGGRHFHRPMSQSKFGRIVEWHNRYCGGDKAPLVQEIDICGQSQASTLSN